MSIIDQWKDFWYQVGRGGAIVLSQGDVVPPYERPRTPEKKQ